ncbi:MAG: MnhB domain-containing protein [Myxococcales bacterium]|nr:MnhB domain-containing protein [Myxococcales bacterium]
MLAAAAFLLWRGHNAPGGGFAAGLVVGAGVALRALGGGPGRRARALRAAPRHYVVIGLGLALAAGALGSAFGAGFLDALWVHPSVGPAWGTPLLFDVGVCLLVVGVVSGFVLPLAEAE